MRNGLMALAMVGFTGCGPDAAVLGEVGADEDSAVLEGSLTSSNRVSTWFPMTVGNSWTLESTAGTRSVRVTQAGGQALLEGLFERPVTISVDPTSANTLRVWDGASSGWLPFVRFGYAVTPWSVGTAPCSGLAIKRSGTGVARHTRAGTFSDTRVFSVEQVVDPRVRCRPAPFAELSFAAGVGLVSLRTPESESFTLRSAQVNGRALPTGSAQPPSR